MYIKCLASSVSIGTRRKRIEMAGEDVLGKMVTITTNVLMGSVSMIRSKLSAINTTKFLFVAIQKCFPRCQRHYPYPSLVKRSYFLCSLTGARLMVEWSKCSTLNLEFEPWKRKLRCRGELLVALFGAPTKKGKLFPLGEGSTIICISPVST